MVRNDFCNLSLCEGFGLQSLCQRLVEFGLLVSLVCFDELEPIDFNEYALDTVIPAGYQLPESGSAKSIVELFICCQQECSDRM